MSSNNHRDVTGRRQFLAHLPLAVAGSALVLSEAAGGSDAPPALPTIRLGEHRISRLIAGWNPIAGYSYLGSAMDRKMREYFTLERTVAFLQNCERNGIMAWQLDHVEKGVAAVRARREQGSKMKFLCLHAEAASIEKVVADIAPIAIVHHGGVTDRLFREGKSEQVRDFVQRVRDAGILAGVSAHNPDCIKRVADEGWPVDLFMTCFYYLTRSDEERQQIAPGTTLQIGHYTCSTSDPLAMTAVARQVDQPCLGFKILAAGQRCGNEQEVAEAFKFAFDHLKPTDGAIVGMYPRGHDQVGENAQHARQVAVPGKT
ncbi:MAG: hypothetical protein JSW27_02640 [Phycisphaerales bacterium]|nr:MAG: hypothetical protein JSW27_02640 [Phycisphaerales bacterium]